MQEAARTHSVAMVLEGGRPNWGGVLHRVLSGKRVEELRGCGVYFCGGKAVGDDVRNACMVGVDVGGVRVRPKFYTESFY